MLITVCNARKNITSTVYSISNCNVTVLSTPLPITCQSSRINFKKTGYSTLVFVFNYLQLFRDKQKNLMHILVICIGYMWAYWMFASV